MTVSLMCAVFRQNLLYEAQEYQDDDHIPDASGEARERHRTSSDRKQFVNPYSSECTSMEFLHRHKDYQSRVL